MDIKKEEIVSRYIDFVQRNKKRPKSINSFMKGLKRKEQTFYIYFKSFDQLEDYFWNALFEKTRDSISEEEVYNSYSVNEKLLAFYFSWVSELKSFREYVKYAMKAERIYELYPRCFESFKASFEEYCDHLVAEGLATDEIAKRFFLTDKYKYMLWYQPVSIIKFWVKDTSKDYEDTDALIEKTVNFSFDLMRSNGMDSFFDLAKFHIQHF